MLQLSPAAQNEDKLVFHLVQTFFIWMIMKKLQSIRTKYRENKECLDLQTQ